jgi:transposase
MSVSPSKPIAASSKRSERFGDWKNTHRRFSRWAKNGVWQRVFEHLAAAADNESAMIDSTIVRAHQHSAGAPKKR